MEHFKKYFPSQPEIQKNTMTYQEIKPAGTWYSNEIALYYQFKTQKDGNSVLSLIPDGCFDIIFCCDSNKPNAFLWTTPMRRKTYPDFKKDCEYFGVRFYPEQTILNMDFPMNELLGRQIPLFEVMKGEKSIIDQIAESILFPERIRFFEQFLLKSRIDMGKDGKLLKYMISEIYASHGLINLSELNDKIGYSPQYIRKKFRHYIGFSQKQFTQVVQFQNALDMFLENSQLDVLDIIYENGYYDQAHFIKGFKKFTMVTPTQYKNYFHSEYIG